MNHRLAAAFEQNPILAWCGSLFATIAGTGQWFMQHADDFTKVVGLVVALLGAVAGWYTFRIQRRAWKRAVADDIAKK